MKFGLVLQPHAAPRSAKQSSASDREGETLRISTGRPKSSDMASVTGRANRDSSVDLKGALKASGRQAHHKAMPREDLPEFLRALSA